MSRPLVWQDHHWIKAGFAAGDSVEQLVCWSGLSPEDVLSVLAGNTGAVTADCPALA